MAGDPHGHGDHEHGHAAAPAPGRDQGVAAAGDHASCAGHGEELASGAVQLTPGRRRILDILCAAGRPLGAYEMIDLVGERTGKRPAPISIYRALDFLVEAGLVHRLSSRNAFLACGHRHGAGEPVVFLICDTCGTVSERGSAALGRALDELAAEAGFTRRTQVIEVAGLCRTCRAA